MIVVFISGTPFIKQHKIDMYVDTISQYYKIFLWDISGIYSRKYDNVQERIADAETIDSLGLLDSRLQQISNGEKIIVITGLILSRLQKIYSILKNNNVTIVNINKECFAEWMGEEASSKNRNISLKDRFKYVLKKIGVFRRIYINLKYPRIKYDYLLSSFNFYPEENKKFVKIHHIKYDEYISAKKEDAFLGEKYILFIDAALADHPMYTGKDNCVDRNCYLDQLNNYFKLLETTYRLPVVISAHPKSSYRKEDFNGRQVIMYKTPNLIQNSEFVVSHYSTSLVNAVLTYKPISVLISEELLGSVSAFATLMGVQFAEMINAEIVSLDNPVINPSFVDKER